MASQSTNDYQSSDFFQVCFIILSDFLPSGSHLCHELLLLL